MKNRKKPALAAACLALVTALYAGGTPEREDWTVHTNRLPPAFDGLRLTLLTDLHGAVYGDHQSHLLRSVEDSRPDVIAICGDLVDEATDRTMVPELIENLCRIAPTYYVTGNHEWALDDREQLLRDLETWGAVVLRQDYAVLERQGQQLVLAGADDFFGWPSPDTPQKLLEQIRRQVPGDPYVVVLYHRNNHLSRWAETDADLILSGHGHGGVIRLPLVGGLLGVDRTFFPKDAEGLYRQGRTVQAVSRGAGGARLWNRPHLPTVVLKRSKEP